MTPEHWQHIKSLVGSVLEQNADERAAALQQSCANDLSLQHGVEALLSFHEQATRNLAAPPAKLSSAGTMSPERWQQVEQVFQSVLELAPAERAAFLDKACGDDVELKQEVEALLVFQTGMSGVIQGAVHEAAGLLANESQKARFTPGTTLNKRYRIIGQLGKGGMGEVYRADDLKLGHPVALKFLTEKLSNDKAMLARFHSEVAMAHRVTHPNVCRVHDIGEVATSSGKLHFLSMEYVDGEDLSSLLRRIGRLPADKAVEIANQLCAGLAAAHEAGVLHRDLKPANVMLDGKGRVRITDFGLAGFADTIRNEEVFAGTPAYMSPEQFAGKEVTTKSDIYALGLVLYEIFTGKRVFEAGSLDELRRLHESSSPTNPSNWVKDIDPLVERVILRCLEKEPSKRLASAKQVADALPGGDPLAAALALGETPSPEMVAAAGSKVGMKPMYAVVCLLAIIVALGIDSYLNTKVSLVLNASLNDPPEVMASRAREMIKQLGYPQQATDSAYGFAGDKSCFAYYDKLSDSPDRWRPVREGKTPAVHFWYRQSPSPLFPMEPIVAKTIPPMVNASDPPANVSGMIGIELNPIGRLIRFGVVPPQVADLTAQTSEPDWKLAFDLAGLDFNRFTSTTAQWMPNPPGVCDIQIAWTGTYADQPELPIRVEAAAYRGKLVSFQLIAPYTKPQSSEKKSLPGEPIEIVQYLMLFTIVLGIPWLIRHNLRHKRGDVRGALRLAAVVFTVTIIAWILGPIHNLAFALFFGRVGDALFQGTMAGLMYLALEPFIRRRWPNLLITWTRVLQGNLRDPLVGRDVLIGVLWSRIGNLADISQYLYGGRLSDDSFWANPGLGTRYMVAIGIGQVSFGILLSFGYFFLLFLFFLLTRRRWAAGGILLAILLADSSNTLLSGIALLVFFGGFIVILLRFGLLAGTAFIFTNQVAGVSYMTYQISAWNGWNAIFGYFVVLTLAGYAFYTSLGGQKVFAGKLLEE